MPIASRFEHVLNKLLFFCLKLSFRSKEGVAPLARGARGAKTLTDRTIFVRIIKFCSFQERGIKLKELKIGGGSNPYGFMVSTDPFLKFGIKSKNYNRGLALLRGIQLTGVAVGAILMFWLPNPVGIIAFFILIFLTMTFSERIALKIPKFRDDFQEWHAVEHKLVNVLSVGQELTIENLKNAPCNISHCGEGNRFLREPSDEKLQEALRVGKIFLERRV